MTDDTKLIHQLRTGSIKAFKELCYHYSEDMILYAYGLLEDQEAAHTVACDTLLRLWSDDGFQAAEPPLCAFLFQEVRRAASEYRLGRALTSQQQKLGIYT